MSWEKRTPRPSSLLRPAAKIEPFCSKVESLNLLGHINDGLNPDGSIEVNVQLDLQTGDTKGRVKLQRKSSPLQGAPLAAPPAGIIENKQVGKLVDEYLLNFYNSQEISSRFPRENSQSEN